MIYAYKCRTCDAICDSTTRAETLGSCQTPDCRGELRRNYIIRTKRDMPAHFNHTVGKWVSNYTDFADELKRASETATIETGIPHHYVPCDVADLGATNEGMESTNTQRVANGLKPIEF